MDEELYHYGVKGMKWGVRRDYRALVNRRRNEAYRKNRNDYDTGKISNEERKRRNKAAKQAKKDDIARTKKRYANASKQERERMDRDIKRQTVKEVPYRQVKKGATTVNKLLTGIDIGTAAVATAVGSAAMPAMAPLLVTSLATGSAVSIGRNKLIQWGIDRLT